MKRNAFINENIDDADFAKLMNNAVELRKEGLVYERLTEKERKSADTGAWHIKVAVAMMVFVVFCFMAECTSLTPAMNHLQTEIGRMGGWNRKQV